MRNRGNVLILHGGGLVDPSKIVICRIALNLLQQYPKVFIGLYSFESFLNPSYIVQYGNTLIRQTKNARGTVFGTCRGVDFEKHPELIPIAIKNLKQFNITRIIVPGGDGSVRQLSWLVDVFEFYGISIVFPVALTIDGMNGTKVIGIREAVKESVRQVENMVSTSLMTLTDHSFGVVALECQGRDRDDILANVIKVLVKKGTVADYSIDDLLVIAIPSNYYTNRKRLLTKIADSDKPTLVLLSEGSKIKIPYLNNKLKDVRKFRSLVIGHTAQANQQTSQEDIKNIYYPWIDNACEYIIKYPDSSFCLTMDDDGLTMRPLEYLAKLNPRESATPTLSPELENILKKYIVD